MTSNRGSVQVLRLLAGEILLFVSAMFEWAAIYVGGEELAPRYIADLKARAERVS